MARSLGMVFSAGVAACGVASPALAQEGAWETGVDVVVVASAVDTENALAPARDGLMPSVLLTLSRWFIDKVNRDDRQAGIFYFHPWEIDPGQPRQHGVGFKTRFRLFENPKQ